MSENNHKGHFDLSVNLLETIFTALRENLHKKETLTIEDLEDAFVKIRTYWPNLLPIFDATCRECVALNVAKAFVPDARRRDFVTRLVFSRIITGIGRRPLPKSLSYPQVLAPGIQANVQAILSGKEYTVYNGLARSVFVEAGTDKDDEIWQKIQASESLTVSANRILIKLLASFRSFNTRHWEFLRILQATVEPEVCKIDDAVFCEVFEALFGDYETALTREDNRVRFDLYYGESSAEQVRAVLATYQRYRQGINPGGPAKRPPPPAPPTRR